MNKLLTRDDFRESCLARDGYSCVVCNATEVPLSVHHIIQWAISFTEAANSEGVNEDVIEKSNTASSPTTDALILHQADALSAKYGETK